MNSQFPIRSNISPTRNRLELYSHVSMDRSDKQRPSIRKYSKSLAGTPTNSKLPVNLMNREEFPTYDTRVGRSQSISQSRHRRFNSTSNWFYTDSSTSETQTQTSS